MSRGVLLTCVFILPIFQKIYASSVTKPKTAILIVGQDATEKAEELLDDLAELFISNQITPKKFYFPNADWTSIKKAAVSTDFFIYCGHGFSNGGLTGEFGGMYINEFVTAQKIATELTFTHKPVIIYQQACGSAGSSAGDPDDIGIKTARKRISDTATPFFISGAGAYFASNWLGGSYSFLKHFLAGKSIYECFVNNSEWEDIVLNAPFTNIPEIKGLNIGIAGSGSGRNISITYVNGVKYKTITESNPRKRQYNTAFIGPQDFVFADIEKNPN